MARKLNTQNNTPISIEVTPIAKGGEGGVYNVISAPNKLAKIYHDLSNAASREAKISYMKKNPPAAGVSNSIVWVEDLLYSKNGFVGFTMRKVLGYSHATPEELTHLMNFKSHLFTKTEWKKYKFDFLGSAHLRLNVAHKLAAAIKHLHASNYVLADMKPPNILFDPVNGNINIIDIDSIQISAGADKYPATAVTPEYAPPEFHNGSISFNSANVESSWDTFSFAVTVYRLMLGIHPFAGSFKGSFSKVSDIPGAIKEGLFANGIRRKHFHVRPNLHDGFFNLPTSIKDLFRKCFEQGHSDPNLRPIMKDWIQVLDQEISSGFGKNTSIAVKMPMRKKSRKYKRIIPQTPTVHNFVTMPPPAASPTNQALIQAFNFSITNFQAHLNWQTSPHTALVYLDNRRAKLSGGAFVVIGSGHHHLTAIDHTGNREVKSVYLQPVIIQKLKSPLKTSDYIHTKNSIQNFVRIVKPKMHLNFATTLVRPNSAVKLTRKEIQQNYPTNQKPPSSIKLEKSTDFVIQKTKFKSTLILKEEMIQCVN